LAIIESHLEPSVARMTEAKSGVNTMDPHVAALVQAITG
jgi:hypothetical protein